MEKSVKKPDAPALSVKRREAYLRRMYVLLESSFGDMGWWPADTPFEVMIGAVLTQNTSWGNVEKAIRGLKEKGDLDPSMISSLSLEKLSSIIRPSGYFRQKAARLKGLSRFIIDECGGELKLLKRKHCAKLRDSLLGIKGIGPETADAILLYAFEKPVFVVDAYTKRIFSRHGLVNEKVSYYDLQSFARKALPVNTKVLNQFHALLVETGKRYCRKKAGLCGECPLNVML